MFDARSNTPRSGFVRPTKVKEGFFTLRPFFIVSLALLFSFNALGGDLLVGELWAARESSGLTSVGLDSTGSPSPLKILSAANFTLPQELGYIQESTEVPNSGRTVIHIQDAHCNYAAQKSIAEILNYLTTEYGINTVNCEGAAEGYDLSPFTDIPEKEVREKTADFFVKEGVVSAAEYYAVNNPKKVSLWGVEDPNLYLKNLKVYRDSLAHKDEVDLYIKSVRYILDNLKRHIYSDELQEFDRQYTGYKEGKIPFKEYMLYLTAAARKRMIDIKSFPNIYLLSQTLSEEDKINFKHANNEKDEVVDKLKKSLSRNEMEELMTMVAKLKTERISQADFYAYLAKKARSVKLELKDYPELHNYIIYISIYGAIDRTKITKEMDELENKISESLYENDTQRELGILSKNLTLTKNIFNISLTRDDFTYYMEHRSTFAVANYVKFIDANAPLYKISAILSKNIDRLDQYRDNMDQFYETSLERDKAFIKNIKFTDHDRPNSIIITGGFHTENLRELFKNENVSYISIMPKFKNEKDYVSPYMKRLAGQRTAIENVIDTAIPAILNLQVAEILAARLADSFYGKITVEFFKRILVPMVAALIRGQSFILRVGRGIRVKGSDRDDQEKFVIFPRGPGPDILGDPVVKASLEPNQQANAVLTRTASGELEFGPVTGQPQEKVTETMPEEEAVVEAPAVPVGVTPALTDEERFAQDVIRPLSGDVRKGVLNIYLIKTTPQTIAGMAASASGARNVFEKKLGLDTVILYYTDAKGQRAQLKRLTQLFSQRENKERYPMAFANCMDTQELKAVRAFISRNRSLKDMIAIGRDFGKGRNRIPEQVKVMFVGSTIMNDRRLSKTFNMSAASLFESRKNMLQAFEKYGIISISDINKVLSAKGKMIEISTIDSLTVEHADLLADIMDNIWKGALLLNCSKVDWKTFDEWKKSQEQLLRSV